MTGCAHINAQVNNCKKGIVTTHFVSNEWIGQEQRRRCAEGHKEFCGSRINGWYQPWNNHIYAPANSLDSFKIAQHEIAHYCGWQHF